MQSFKDLVKLMETLRGEKGCAWDKKQTFETLKDFILEEADEVAQAVDNKDHENLKEELGDLSFMIIFLSRIAEERGLFDIKDVLEHSKEKMIRRHPHVFGDKKLDDTEKILEQWHKIKMEEKKGK